MGQFLLNRATNVVDPASPLISVLMPTYNGRAYVSDAIESVLQQTFEAFELIIVDDGSTDDTPDLVRSFHDPRIRFFQRERHSLVDALNYAASRAQAEWLARHDADDVSRPDRLHRQWKAVHRGSHPVLCYSRAAVMGDTEGYPPAGYLPRGRALLAFRLCFENPIVHSTVLMRKEAFHAAGGYRPGDRHAEDFGLWGRLLELGPVRRCPQRLVEFRIHAGSASRRFRQEQHARAVSIALCHSQKFLGVASTEAQHAFKLYHHEEGCGSFREWVRLLLRTIPRLRWHSLELYAWLAVHTVKRCAGHA